MKTSSKQQQEVRASGKLRKRRSSRANSKVCPCFFSPAGCSPRVYLCRRCHHFRNKVCARVLQAPTSSGGTLSSRQDEIWQGKAIRSHHIRVLLTAHPSAQRPMTRHITSSDNCSTLNARSIQHYLLSTATQNLSWNALRVCNAWPRSRNEQITIPLLPPSMRITIARIITLTPRPTALPEEQPQLPKAIPILSH